MSKTKKIVLSATILVSMLMVCLVGLIGFKFNDDNTISYEPYVYEYNHDYTYEPGEVSIQRGPSNIEYEYVPSTDAKSAQPIAYEYVFHNPSSVAQAINLKSIDTTGVNVGYAYNSSRLTTIEGATDTFSIQPVGAKRSIYIYVVVTPKNEEIPATFQSSMVWFQGFKGEIIVYDTDCTTQLATHEIIKGQEVDYLLPEINATIEGYEFEGWYHDPMFENKVEGSTQGGDLYPRVPNMPTDWLELIPTGYAVKRGTTTLPDKLIIPQIYNKVRVTRIGNGDEAQFIFKETKLKSVNLPTTIKKICNSAFAHCGTLTIINIPGSVTNIGDDAFLCCYGLTEVYDLNSNFTISVEDTTLGYVGYYANIIYTDPTTPSKIIENNGIMYYVTDDVCEAITPTDRESTTSPILDAQTTSIKRNAFYGCGLTTIDLSNCTNLTAIGNNAFTVCDNLTSITLPSSLVSIGEQSFSVCQKLTNIDFSRCSALTTLGKWFIIGNEDLTYLDLSDCIALTTIGTDVFTGNGIISLDFPINLTTIETEAFSDCEELVRATIPNKVTSIGERAFYSCGSLEEVDLSNSISLTTIGNYAFQYCSSLTSVNLSNCTNLATIGAYAFNNTGLTTLTLPSSVTSIGNYAFQSCASLTSVNLSNCTNLATIGAYAFNNTVLTTLTLPSSVTSIGNYAFNGCTELTSADLSNCTSLTSTGIYTFQNCTSLSSVSFPTSLTTIGSYAFQGCRSLTSIIIPTSVTTIGSYAFGSCYALAEVYDLSTSLTLSTGTTSNGHVGYYAKVVHTDSATTSRIVESKGVKYYVDDTNHIALTPADRNTITSVVLDDETTAVNQYAFYNCASLTSVTIPANVTTIGTNAFQNSYSITEVYNMSTSLTITLGDSGNGYVAYYAAVVHNDSTVEAEIIENNGVRYYITDNDYIAIGLADPSVKNVVIDSQTTGIKPYAFSQTLLETVDLSNCNSLTSIGNYAFDGCSKLTSVDLSSCNSLISTGTYTFQNCTSLTSVNLSNCTSLATIGDYAFNGCGSLSSTDLSNCSSLTSIGPYAFQYCRFLTSIIMPTSVTSIGTYAFYYCISLTSIIIPTSVTTIGGCAFQNCYALAEVYDLSTALTIKIQDPSSYFVYNGHVGYYAKVVHTDSATTSRILESKGVKYYVYDTDYIALTPVDRNTITSVVLDEETTAVNKYAFYNCTSLTSVDLTNCTNLTLIGEYAFYNCKNLTTFVIPANVNKIGAYVFKGAGLTSLTFEDVSTWYKVDYYYTTDWNNMSGGTSVSASNLTAKNFTSTDGYNNYHWYKL